jgi:hypothetical protein
MDALLDSAPSNRAGRVDALETTSATIHECEPLLGKHSRDMFWVFFESVSHINNIFVHRENGVSVDMDQNILALKEKRDLVYDVLRQELQIERSPIRATALGAPSLVRSPPSG